MRTIAAVSVALAVFTMPAQAQAAWKPDPFFGTWTLIGADSHYAQTSPPEQMTLVIEPAQDGLAYRSEAHYAGGRVSSSQFVARLDDTPAIVVGRTGLLAPVSLAPADEGSINATYRSGLKKVAWSHWSVNQEGSELVITTTYLGAQGEEQRNVTAFHRAKT